MRITVLQVRPYHCNGSCRKKRDRLGRSRFLETISSPGVQQDMVLLRSIFGVLETSDGECCWNYEMKD